MKKIWQLIISLAMPQLAGLIGSLFTAPSINNWYATLNRPVIAPPNWIFAPVWTALFLLMGLAVYLVWSKGFKSRGVKPALIVFSCQLVLNVFWSVLFFGLHSPLWALMEIILLWLMILWTSVLFFKVFKVSE